GRVIMPWRSPETVAMVRARPVGTAYMVETRPDPYGRFRFDGLGVGPHLVELIDEWTQSEIGSFDSVAAIVDVAPGGVSTIDLRAGSGCIVEGLVSGDSFGKSWSNLRIELHSRDEDSTGATRVTSPDDTGFFNISSVQPGSYEVRLESVCEGLALSISKNLE